MEGHKIKLAFEDGGYSISIIHPENGEGCEPVKTCGECGLDVSEPESEKCEHCPRGTDLEGCWIQPWADGGDLHEAITGEVTVPVTVGWEGEYPSLEISDGAAA